MIIRRTSVNQRSNAGTVRAWVAGLTAATLAIAAPAAAQTAGDSTHVGHTAVGHGEPASTPAVGTTVGTGTWSVVLHGFATFGSTRQGGPRGATTAVTTSMASLVAGRRLGAGHLSFRMMASAEALMGPDGYPLLLQTGESADGLLPLRDRQHPHDALAELAVSYRRPLDPDLDGFVYLGLVGAPALGPVPFFHRASGMDLPEAPIGHHLHDATHVTHGVLTFGIVSRGVLTMEFSLFNGREPDGDRWDLDALRLDSYSVRAGVAIGRNLSIQGSAAVMSQPERLHPTIDQARLSLSGTYNHPLRSGNWQTTLALGRSLSKRQEILVSEAQRIFPPSVLAHYLGLGELPGPADSLYLVFPSKTRSGWLLESSLALGRSVFTGRVERVAKDELFDPTDIRHSQVFSVAKLSAGYFRWLPLSGALSAGLGGVVSLHLLPRSIRADYGGSPTSSQVYARIDIGRGMR